MKDVLALCAEFPVMQVSAGTLLIKEGVPMGRIYVLKRGVFEVVRNGVRLVTISEPGAFLGEMSALLGSAPTANVVAAHDSTVHVVDTVSGTAEAPSRWSPAITTASKREAAPTSQS